MDLRGYLRALRRNMVLILVCVIGVMALAFAVSENTDKSYDSKARVIVSSSRADTTAVYTDTLLAQQRAATYVEVVKSSLLAERVRDDLGLDDSISDLIDHVSASAVQDSTVLELRFVSDSAERAQEIAQAYADQLVGVARDIEAPDDGGDLPTRITVLDAATYNESPVAPRTLLNLVLGLLLGLVLGVSIAVLREMLDTSITTSEDLEEVTDAPVLGTIVHEAGFNRQKLVTELDHHSARVEAFRVLRTNVQFVDVDSSHKLFVVSSSVKEEGKTSTAINLALTLARAGVKTLLVDGDLRRPKVAETFEIDGTAGVTTVLLGKVDLGEAVWHHDETGLDVLPAGVTPPNAAELLQTMAMATLLQRVRAEYDVVLIDSPPLLPVTDAALLAARSDGVLLVVRHGRTNKDAVSTAIDRLAQVDVTPIGVVLNDVPVARRAGGYSGYGGYGTYAGYAPQAPKTSSRGRRRDKR